MTCDISDYIYIHREMIELPDSAKDAKNRFPIVEHTKTNRNRKFPVTRKTQEFLDKLKILHRENDWDSEFLFPADNENGCITANAVYKFYWNMCKTLGIEISHSFRKVPHSFRRTKVTEIINKSGGNVIMAAQLFGHSPEVAKNHYYVGLDLDEARKILEN